ncbi:MAG TPA: hypothetical protein PLU27_00795 [Ginsengibacter sp.]|nr:hypothetical protein [Ginsengibacter sp.]
MRLIKTYFATIGTILIAITCYSQSNQIPCSNTPKAWHYTHSNGIDLYHEIYGKGQPLLITHGNRDSISAGMKQIPFFSNHFKVIAVDSREQGKTNDHSASLTYSLITEDFNALLNCLKFDSALIFGQERLNTFAAYRRDLSCHTVFQSMSITRCSPFYIEGKLHWFQ